MKTKRNQIKYFSILFLFITIIYGQSVPYVSGSRLVDWSNAGLYEDSPGIADHIISISSSGSIATQIETALSQANSQTGTTIIYFPEGTYNISSTINISNCKKSGIIFQGAGVDKTILNFSINEHDHCFLIEGSFENGSDEITGSTIIKGNTPFMYSPVNTDLINNDWILFSEPGLDDDYESTSDYVGQVTRISKFKEITLWKVHMAEHFFQKSY